MEYIPDCTSSAVAQLAKFGDFHFSVFLCVRVSARLPDLAPGELARTCSREHFAESNNILLHSILRCPVSLLLTHCYKYVANCEMLNV